MLPEPTLNSYLVLSAVLFAIGTAGVFLRRNLITILLSIEVMLNAVNLMFVAVDRFLGTIDGQIIVFFVMTVAAAEAAVGTGSGHRAVPASGVAEPRRLHDAQMVMNHANERTRVSSRERSGDRGVPASERVWGVAGPKPPEQ